MIKSNTIHIVLNDTQLVSNGVEEYSNRESCLPYDNFYVQRNM